MLHGQQNYFMPNQGGREVNLKSHAVSDFMVFVCCGMFTVVVESSCNFHSTNGAKEYVGNSKSQTLLPSTIGRMRLA